MCSSDLNAAAEGEGGEVLVLDMGEPVRIADVAQRLADAAPRRIEIQYTGLRPGEKLHEVLLAANEVAHRPRHPKVDHVVVPPLDVPRFSALDDRQHVTTEDLVRVALAPSSVLA